MKYIITFHNCIVLMGSFSEKLRFFFLSQKTTELTVWTRRGTEAAEWLKAQVTISLMDTQRVSKLFSNSYD